MIREEIKERRRLYRINNKEKIVAYREVNKERARVQAKERYEKNKEHLLAKGKEWRENNKDRVKVLASEWSKKNKGSINIAAKRFYFKHLEKNKSRNALRRAVRMGRLTRPDSCEACDKPGSIHGHHHDYNEALKVTWLCSQCHADLHVFIKEGNIITYMECA